MTDKVILYSTEGCHLCEHASEMIANVNPAVQIETVDIAYDDALYQRYRFSIPVLKNGQGKELNWPFDSDTLNEFLS